MTEILRHLILAGQLLTRLPLPQITPQPGDMGDATALYPTIGIIIGGLLGLLALLLPTNPWLNSLILTLAWIAITGGLHLDGAADLADGLGASHRDPERLLAAMKDPHIGSFGVLVLIGIVLTKVITLATLLTTSGNNTIWILILAPAWARLGAAWWASSLPPLGNSMGAAIAQQRSRTPLTISALLLTLLGIALYPPIWLIIPPLFLLGWRLFLHQRIGGFNGDCLGAGIEYGECALLLAAALIA
ncbi:MAG: adenosylcobinamide-GDP ribazoletransferase [Mariprofundales bacterium]|nr:adenosylcobinamide-GDP ribazoletransferase [Mariprofundales bacterium]